MELWLVCTFSLCHGELAFGVGAHSLVQVTESQWPGLKTNASFNDLMEFFRVSEAQRTAAVTLLRRQWLLKLT